MEENGGRRTLKWVSSAPSLCPNFVFLSPYVWHSAPPLFIFKALHNHVFWQWLYALSAHAKSNWLKLPRAKPLDARLARLHDTIGL